MMTRGELNDRPSMSGLGFFQTTSVLPIGDGVVSTLDAFTLTLSLPKETCSILPAQVAFGSAVVLLTVIWVRLPLLCGEELLTHVVYDSMANDQDYVDLGRTCADRFQALDRGSGGRRLDKLNRSVLGAIGQPTDCSRRTSTLCVSSGALINLSTVELAEIQRRVIKPGKRNVTSRILNAKDDKDKIAA